MVMPIGDFRPRRNWTHSRQFFYKYMTAATAKVVLHNRTLRWSTPARLNDPFDVRFDPDIRGDFQAIKEDSLNRLWNMHYSEDPPPAGNPLGWVIHAMRGIFPQLGREEFNREFGESFDEAIAAMRANLPDLHQQLRQQAATTKVLCLAERSDNLLMWAHYANGHHGVCLEFQCVPELDSAWGAAKAVTYVTELPLLYDPDLLAGLLAGESMLTGAQILDRLIYSKSIDWAYEQEWRISTGEGRDPLAPFEDGLFHTAELSSVIIGCEMPAEVADGIVALAGERYPGAAIKRARKSRTGFAIEIR